VGPGHRHHVAQGLSQRDGGRVAVAQQGGVADAFELRDGEWVLIATAKDDEPVSIRPFDAITFSLGDLWP